VTSSPDYCIDSSSLIAGYLEIYHFERFPGLWEKMADMAESGRLIAPQVVYRELTKQDNEMAEWVKLRRRMFVEQDTVQDALMRQLARAFPILIDPVRSFTCASTADQLVVALAKSRGCLLVSEEKKGSYQKPKIPQLCGHLGVTQISFADIIRREGWIFS
jgi:hypothetical protein